MAPDPDRPTAEQLASARDRTVPDLVGPDLDVLFVGINPGVWSGATGHHFARPGNRFWATLHRAGFTPRQLRPSEERELLPHGIGITNLVERTTANAAELSSDELRAGGERVRVLVERWSPRTVAFLGVSTFGVAFGVRRVTIGPQPERIGGSAVWVLPNPSGLNAHYQLPALVERYGELRAALGART